MNLATAARALGALAQESRLAVLRMLVRAGPAGLPAGEIGRNLAVPASTLSAHLTILANAGLVTATRAGRSIRYAVDREGLRALLGFLVEDCCQGRPELCAPLLDSLSCEPEVST